MALIRGGPLILFAAFWCHAAQPGSIPSDAAKVPPAQVQGFLEMICPGHASATGCLVCPEETPFSGSPSWDLQTITFGHFLRPTSEDALVFGTGCEPHVNGFSGAYLFTKERSSWRRVWYRAGENASDCKKLTGSDGRDLLVCEGADMHQGVGDWFLYLLDAGQDPSKVEDNIVGFFGLDDSLGGCTQLPDGTVLTGAIEAVSFSPAKPSRAVRISVTARLGKAAIPAKIMSDCDQSNGKIRPTIATVLRRYEFLFNGQKIVPDAKNPPTDHGEAIAPLTSYSMGK
jgi:hypothetical protein